MGSNRMEIKRFDFREMWSVRRVDNKDGADEFGQFRLDFVGSLRNPGRNR